MAGAVRNLLDKTVGEAIKGVDSVFSGKLTSELENSGDLISGKAARDAADAETKAAQAAQKEREAAQLLYDQQEENNKKQAAARARQKSLNTGIGRQGTILTSPLGSAGNQTAADMSAKTLLGS